MQNNYFKTILFLLVFSFNSYAQFNPPPCEAPYHSQELDINNVRAKFWASGSMWFDPITTNSNYEVPKGEGNHSFFAFDLWMGVLDEFGQKRLDWQMYAGNLTANTYFAGPLNDSGYTDFFTCENYDRVWKINKSPNLQTSKSSIHLFPNPATANTLLYLEQKQTLQKGTLQLFDGLGRLVESVTLKKKRQNEMLLPELSSGIYFYQIEWQNGSVENRKLMVQ